MLVSPRRARAEAITESLKQQIAAAETTTEILALMRRVTTEHTELFDQLKASLHKSFSKWKWPAVRQKFKLPDILPQWIPKECRVPDAIIDWTIDAHNKVLKAHGPKTTGKEIRRNLYIQMLITSIIAEFETRIRIDDEGALESSVSGGCVEFVLLALERVVVSVIESKTDLVSHSKGQLFLELNAALEMNILSGFDVPTLRGVVSNAVDWYFYEYTRTVKKLQLDGEEEDDDDDDDDDDTTDIGEIAMDSGERVVYEHKLSESPTYPGDTDERLREVGAKLYWMMLQAWCDVQDSYVKLWRAEVEFRTPVKTGKAERRRQRLFDFAIVSLQAATTRQTVANEVLGLALAAKNNQEAVEALAKLKQCLCNPDLFK